LAAVPGDSSDAGPPQAIKLQARHLPQVARWSNDGSMTRIVAAWC